MFFCVGSEQQGPVPWSADVSVVRVPSGEDVEGKIQ